VNAKEAWIYLVMIVLGLASYKFLTGPLAVDFAAVLVIGGVLELVHGTALKSVERIVAGFGFTVQKPVGLSAESNRDGGYQLPSHPVAQPPASGVGESYSIGGLS
jgi:hypothetical protein